MSIATGVGKQIAYKKEVTWNVDPGATGAAYLRRVTSDLDMTRDMYSSAQIRTDYQISSYVGGIRKVTGTIKDELSCTTWKDFIAAALRKAWVAGVNSGALATVASTAGAVGVQKIARSSGSWLTDGFKQGDVVQMTGWTTTAVGMNTRNYMITSVTASDMFLAEVQVTAPTLVSKVAGDSVTVTVQGSKVMVPTTGHTRESFTIEHRFTDIGVYERFNGCRVNTLTIDLPSTGIATLSVGLLGGNMQSSGTAYFTAPITAAPTTGSMAAVSGMLAYNGAPSSLITAATITIDGGMTTGSAVGSNYTPDVFPGRVKVTGNLSMYFQDADMRDAFLNETTPPIAMAFGEDGTADSNVLTIVMPKVKLGGFTKNDGEQGLVATGTFQALYNGDGGAGTQTDQSTIVFQDTTF